MHPLFITFEGGEGVGKSTQGRLLKQSYEQAGLHCVMTREPGGTDEAEAIRRLLVEGEQHKWLPKTELLLHLAARYEHVYRFIQPALEGGNHVICDRFSDSTLAYQGYGHQLGTRLIVAMHQQILGDLRPDITFVFTLDEKQGLTRARQRQSQECRYESMDLDFHQRVTQGFKMIREQNPERCVLIRAEKSMQAIHHDIIKLLNERYALHLPVIQLDSQLS